MNSASNKIETRAASLDFAHPWTPDCGDGTYRNPILYADYSDPDVVRHGEDFWMTASSFNCTPGLPILHSRDLVNWTLVNHASKQVPGEHYREVQHGCGVWAPAIRFHTGKFWIFFPTPDEGIYVTTANDPRGQWSEPHLLQAGKGLIDPCPLWDDDGKAYLVHAYAGSRAGIKHRLRVAPMSPDGTRLLGEGQIVFHEPERHHTIEGPKFLKRDGWYYILAPAGGVQEGWQTVLRSRNIYGPYEDKIVLHQGSTLVNGPHQGALVDTPGGEWWFLHFQDAGVYGRVVHLQPVEWREGWPMMGALSGSSTPGEPVLHHRKPTVNARSAGNLDGVSQSRLTSAATTPSTSDEWSSSKLGLQWQWHANHRDDWFSLTARTGWLRLYAQKCEADDLKQRSNLLLQKFPAREFTVEVSLDFSGGRPGDEAGLIIMGRAHAAIALRKTEYGTQLVFRNGEDRVFDETSSNTAMLRVTVREGGACSFSHAGKDGGWIELPGTFQAQPGVWIGAKVGLYCAGGNSGAGGGFADFDHFRFARCV